MDKYKVTLLPEERQQLMEMIHKGKSAARKLAHARILLLTDESDGRQSRTDAEIAEVLQVSPDTVARVRKRFVMENLEAAVHPRPRPPRPDKIKIQDIAEQKLIELACSDPPDGRGVWTLQLLADQLVVLGYVESVGRETVRQSLKKTTSGSVR